MIVKGGSAAASNVTVGDENYLMVVTVLSLGQYW